MSQQNNDSLALTKDVSQVELGDREFNDFIQETAAYLGADVDAKDIEALGATRLAAPPAKPRAAPAVVLSCGAAKVSMPEADYVEMLGEHALAPPADGLHSTLAVLYLARSAEKRGLADLAKKLMDLRNVGRGLVFVRRPDGSFFTPTPVTTIRVARAKEEQRATAAEVEEYFGRGGG